jgi:bifunctional DNase/RNase
MADPNDLIEVQLARVILQEKSEQQFLLLKERGTERCFTIVIGINEAAEIRRKLQGMESTRPLTHDLLGRIVKACGYRLSRVIVNDLREATFFATLVLESTPREGNGKGDRGELVVDCRPSDAICLAVQTKVPIFVARKVIDRVA